MPTQVNSASSVISNDLDDFVSGSIGPEQSTSKVLSCQYVSFDYGGQFAADPFVAVEINFEPLDGSNDNKPFKVEWTTGGKLSDFAIVDDGGKLAATGSRTSLDTGSNWALFLRSLKDAGYDTKLLNGDKGIAALNDADLTIKRVPQPARQGMAVTNDKGRTKTYYTCLKIDSLPGEKKGGAKKAAAAKSPAAKPAGTTPAAAAAAASNGNSSASSDAVEYIKAALATAGGTISMDDLPKAVFDAAKAAGKSAADAFAFRKVITPDQVAKIAEANDLVLDEGNLVDPNA